MKLKWLSYFAEITEVTAKQSKDPSTKVGALIVDPESKAILATGFNGFPRGVYDDPNDDYDRYQGEARYLHTCHAELNSILHAARAGTKVIGTTIICNRLPCVECTKAIIQSGIKAIYFRWTEDLDKVDLLDMNNWRSLALKYVPRWCSESGIKLYYYNYPKYDSRVDKPVITECFQVRPIELLYTDYDDRITMKSPYHHDSLINYYIWRVNDEGVTHPDKSDWHQRNRCGI